LQPQSTIPQAEIKTVADFQKAYGETPFEDFTDTFKLNTTAVWYTIVAFLGLLDQGNKKGNVEQKSQVIATSSIGGFNRAVPGGYPYGLVEFRYTKATFSYESFGAGSFCRSPKNVFHFVWVPAPKTAPSSLAPNSISAFIILIR